MCVGVGGVTIWREGHGSGVMSRMVAGRGEEGINKNRARKICREQVGDERRRGVDSI